MGRVGGPSNLPGKRLGILADEDGRRNAVPLLQVRVGARAPREVPYHGHAGDGARPESICEQTPQPMKCGTQGQGRRGAEPAEQADGKGQEGHGRERGGDAEQGRRAWREGADGRAEGTGQESGPAAGRGNNGDTKTRRGTSCVGP